MHRYLFLFACLFSSNVVCCQDIFENAPLFGLKWTPTSLFNPNTATFMLGAEYWFSEKHYAQAEFGFPFWKWPKEGANARTDWRYQKRKLGYRQIVGFERNVYFGFDFFQIPQSYTHFNGTSPYQPRIHIKYQEAVIEKDAYGATILFGYRLKLSTNWFLEFYKGAGLKIMDVEHKIDLDKATLASGPPPSGFLTFDNFDKTPGTKRLPYFDLGIKIGWLSFRGR